MNSRTFGGVLENLLYISKQKKSSLASYLGYDASYINKWVNSKNLPSFKKAAEISEDNSILFMWVTMPFLKDCFDVIKSWGFNYKTCGFCWVKTQPTVLIICDFNKILSKQILRLSAQNDVVYLSSY